MPNWTSRYFGRKTKYPRTAKRSRTRPTIIPSKTFDLIISEYESRNSATNLI